MSELIFRGQAAAVAQVNTETPANVEVGDIFTVRLTNATGATHLITFTATGATVQNVVEGLKAAAVAANSAGQAPWNAVTCTEDDTKMTITADTAGEPFYVVTTATEGGVADTQTLTDANTTACAGPKIIDDLNNYDGRVAPTTGDSIVIPAGISATIYGKDLSAIDLQGFTVEEGCTADIGCAERPLQISLKEAEPAYWDANLAGTGNIFLEVTNYGTINVTKAGTGGAGTYGVNLSGTHDLDYGDGPNPNTGTIKIDCVASGQKVGIGALGGDDMEVSKIIVKQGTVVVGTDVTEDDNSTAPNLTITGGIVTTYCPLATVIKTGTWIHESGAVGTFTGKGGRTEYNSSSALTTGYISAGETFTLENNPTDGEGNVTISAFQAAKGSTIKDPDKKAVWSNGIDLYRCGISDITLDLGNHITVTPSAL